MNTSDDIEAIRAHFLSGWNSAIPVVLDNEPYTPAPVSVWARFDVEPGHVDRMSIAQRSYRQKGRARLRVFTPVDQGDATARSLTDAFADHFNDWTSSDFRIRFDPVESYPNTYGDQYFVIEVSALYRAQH